MEKVVRYRDWLKRGERNGFIGGQVRLKTRREAGVRVKVVVRFHGLVFNGGAERVQRWCWSITGRTEGAKTYKRWFPTRRAVKVQRLLG